MTETCSFQDGEIQEYCDGALSADRTAVLRDHLTVCPHCAQRLAQYRAVESSLLAQAVQPPADLHPSIMAVLPLRASLPARHRGWTAAAVLLISAVLLGAAVGLESELDLGRRTSAFLSSDLSTAWSALADEAAGLTTSLSPASGGISGSNLTLLLALLIAAFSAASVLNLTAYRFSKRTALSTERTDAASARM